MTCSRFFYRDLFSQGLREFKAAQSVRPEDFTFVITSALDEARKIHCPICSRARRIVSIDEGSAALECGHFVHGPFAECPAYFLRLGNEGENFIFTDDIYSAAVEQSSPSQFRKIIESTIERRKIDVEEFFSRGEDCIPKNQFLYEVRTDDRKFQMEISWHEVKEGTIFSSRICLDLDNGRVLGDWEKRKKLPEEILGHALGTFRELICKWCGFSVTFADERADTALLRKITEFPFCPGISEIIDSPVVKKFHGRCDRTNPECYRQLCKSLKVDDCRTVRKSFAANHQSLPAYKILRHAGFRDINIISRILGSRLTDAIRGNDFEDYLFFLKKARRHCSEKKLAFILLSNMKNEDYYLKDGVVMFRKYYRHVGRVLKNSIFKFGFTELNHDALAVISSSEGKRNLRFRYTAEQRSLEDDVGEFSFRLPRTSRELMELGTELHNCVASYAQRIRDRECTVVYARCGMKYEICIEIRGREVIQQRGKYNRALEGDAASAMERYIQRHGLVFMENKG